MATKLAGLFGDGVDGSCTPISGCAQRARCGKLLSLCCVCVMDTRPPRCSSFWLASSESVFIPPGSLVVAGEGWWRIRAILGVSQRARGVSRHRTPEAQDRCLDMQEAAQAQPSAETRSFGGQATLVWRFPSWPTYHQTGWLKIEMYSLTQF